MNSFFECPYCHRKAATYLDMGNGAFMFNTDKQCGHCFGKIKLNFASLTVMYFSLIIYVIGGLFITVILARTLPKYVIIAILGLLFMCQGAVTICLYSFFKFRLLLPRNDIEAYRKTIPDYLKNYEFNNTEPGIAINVVLFIFFVVAGYLALLIVL